MAGDDPSLLGGAARVVVDRAVPFMEQAVKNDTLFLAVIWFNAPHEPIKAGPEYLAMYEGHGEAAHYDGCITELDEQPFPFCLGTKIQVCLDESTNTLATTRTTCSSKHDGLLADTERFS